MFSDKNFNLPHELIEASKRIMEQKAIAEEEVQLSEEDEALFEAFEEFLEANFHVDQLTEEEVDYLLEMFLDESIFRSAGAAKSLKVLPDSAKGGVRPPAAAAPSTAPSTAPSAAPSSTPAAPATPAPAVTAAKSVDDAAKPGATTAAKPGGSTVAKVLGGGLALGAIGTGGALLGRQSAGAPSSGQRRSGSGSGSGSGASSRSGAAGSGSSGDRQWDIARGRTNQSPSTSTYFGSDRGN